MTKGVKYRRGVLTVRLFPIQSSTDVWRERGEYDSSPTTVPRRIRPFLINRTKNTVNTSIDVRCRLVGCRSTRVGKAYHLNTQTGIVWDDLKSSVSNNIFT